MLVVSQEWRIATSYSIQPPGSLMSKKGGYFNYSEVHEPAVQHMQLLPTYQSDTCPELLMHSQDLQNYVPEFESPLNFIPQGATGQ